MIHKGLGGRDLLLLLFKVFTSDFFNVEISVWVHLVFLILPENSLGVLIQIFLLALIEESVESSIKTLSSGHLSKIEIESKHFKQVSHFS